MGCILWGASLVKSAVVKTALSSPPGLSLELLVFQLFAGEMLSLTFCSNSLRRKAGPKFATEHVKDAQGCSI